MSAVLCAAAMLAAGMFCAADTAAQAVRGSSDVTASRFEGYVGYGYWNPLSSNVNGYRYDTVSDMNAAGGLAYYFTRHLGMALDASYFNDNRTHVPNVSSICGPDAGGKIHCFKDQQVTTLAAGPVYRMQYGRLFPFAHVMGGAEQVNGPVANPSAWGWMAEAGVGVDYVLPFFHDHLAVRPIQADYQYGQVVYGPLVLPAGIVGGAPDIGAIHLSAGLVFRAGSVESAETVEVACSAEPNLVYPGDPVTARAMVRGFGKNPHVDYTWQGAALGKPVHDSAVQISTANLAPGDYHLTVDVTGHGHGKPNLCSAEFTVQAYEPPVVSCSAAPATVNAGDPVTLSAAGRSPQNRPLSYTYTASAGTVVGNGLNASLSTAGAVAGTSITVQCGVTDDLGKSATASTTVVVNAPPPPPIAMPTAVESTTATAPPELAKQEPLCTIYFERDRKRPVRVDNEAKACLDSVALSRNRETLSKLVLVGTYAHGESANAGAERALHAKQYLVDEKGIDAGTIQTMVKASDRKSVESVLLPGDAVFEEDGTMEFDPASVRLQGEAYGKRHPRQ